VRFEKSFQCIAVPKKKSCIKKFPDMNGNPEGDSSGLARKGITPGHFLPTEQFVVGDGKTGEPHHESPG